MKTKEQLLAFYGVEIGKKYKVTKEDGKVLINFVGEIFKIRESPTVEQLIIMFSKHCKFSIRALNYLDYEEIKQPILDDVEREYLQKYVMDNPAFKGKVKFIQKNDNSKISKSYLAIYLNVSKEEIICLPYFTLGSMYKNMEEGKHYTPQELDLIEDCF